MAELTAGALLFKMFLSEHRISNAAASKALAVSDPTIHDWLKGVKRPRKAMREAIAVYTRDSVPPDSWDSESERKIIAAVRPFDEPAEFTADFEDTDPHMPEFNNS